MKKLLLPMLLLCFSTAVMQAKSNFAFISLLSNQVAPADTTAIPWRDGFETDFKTPAYTTTNVAGEAYSRILIGNNSGHLSTQFSKTGEKFTTFYYNNNTGDWLFTPSMFLRAGTTYYFKFWYLTNGAKCYGEVFAGVGFEPKAGSMTQIGENIALPENKEYLFHFAPFTPQSDGIYYFGIYAKKTTVSVGYLSVDDLEVNTAFDCSLLKSVLTADNIGDVFTAISWTKMPTANKYAIEYKLDESSTWTLIDDIAGNQSDYHLTDLLGGKNYQARVTTFCSMGGIIISDTLKFTTLGKVAQTFPVDEKFDGNSGIIWNFENDSTATNSPQRNKWHIDSTLKQVAFISNTQGETNSYETTSASYTYIYTENFLLPKAEEFVFSFDWKAVGQVTMDYLRAYISGNFQPKAGYAQGNTGIFTKLYNLDSNWKTETVRFDESISGTVQHIAFGWVNNNDTNGTQPPAAIDNVSFKTITCGTPKQLTFADYIDEKNLQLACKTFDGENSFDIAYRKMGIADTNWQIQKGNTTGNTRKDSLALKNLDAQSTYQIRVQKRCGTDSSSWSNTIEVPTITPIVKAPFTDDFETFDAKFRTLLNGTETNQWKSGNAVYAGTSGKAMYISNDDGKTNAYNGNKASIVHFYYDVDFPQDAEYSLSFDWKNAGSTNDYMSISLVGLDVFPVAGTVLNKSYRISEKNFYNHRTWAHEKLVFTTKVPKSKKRLIFTWINSGITSSQPPIVIDNINVQLSECTTINNLKVIGHNPTSIDMMSSPLEENTSYEVNYRIKTTDEWLLATIPAASIQNAGKFKIDQLLPNTIYEVKVRKLCVTDSADFTPVFSVRTTQTLATLPLFDDFKSTNTGWTFVNGQETNHWKIDTADNGHLQITDASEIGNAYNIGKSSMVHAYRDIFFSEAIDYELIFNWKGMGENNIDNLSVYLENPDVPLQAGSINDLGQKLAGRSFSSTNSWRNDTLVIHGNQVANMVKTLIFTWQNNASNGNQPPIALNFISLRPIKCSTPTNLEFVEYPEDTNSLRIKFLKESTSNNFLLVYTDLNHELTKYAPLSTTDTTIKIFNCNVTYNLQVKNICGADSSRWSNAIRVVSAQRYGSLPFEEHFENEADNSQWRYPNYNGLTNKWFIGKASSSSDLGNTAAYIDTLDGQTNGYNSSVNSIAFMYKDILFPEAKYEMPLSFRWKNGGENNAYLKVIITNLDYEYPTSWSQPTWNSFVYNSPTFYGKDNDSWRDTTLYLPTAKLAGQKKRLTFVWFSVQTISANPPASIDDILITAAECPTPKSLTSKRLSFTSAEVRWSCENFGTNKYELTYKSKNDTIVTIVTTDTVVVLNSLRTNTYYDVSVVNECGGKFNTIVSTRFLTLQEPVKIQSYGTDGFFEGFSSESITNWTILNHEPLLSRWYMGGMSFTAEKGPLSAAYISGDGGLTNSYEPAKSASIPCLTYIYRDICFDNPNAKDYIISFDWRVMGNGTNYMKVFLVDSAVYPQAGILLTDNATTNLKGSGVTMHSEYYWKSETFSLAKTFGLANVQGKTKRLVFMWRNASTTTIVPPAAAFSNVSIKALDCSIPGNLKVESFLPDGKSVAVGWDSTSTQYILAYREAGGIWSSITVDNRNSDTLRDLLSNNALYEVRVQTSCSGYTMWSPIITFNTLQNLSPIGVMDDFEAKKNRDAWSIVNGNKVNSWYIGSPLGMIPIENHFAYISNDYGLTNSYNITDPSGSTVHLYRDFESFEGQKEIFLSFDWKGMGQEASLVYDYMQVHFISPTTVPVAGTILADNTRAIARKIRLSSFWKKEVAQLSVDASLQSRNRLVFTWVNNATLGTNPAISIDNIKIEGYNCFSPKNISQLRPYQQDAVKLNWTVTETNPTFNIRYKDAGNTVWKDHEIATTDTFTVMDNLRAGGKYEVQIQTYCADNNSYSAWTTYVVGTAQTYDTIPFMETFEDSAKVAQWSFVNAKQPNQWYVGKIPGEVSSNKAVYISDSNGLTYRYQPQIDSSTTNVHFYRDIRIPAAKEYLFSFNWKNYAETNDYLYLSLTDTAYFPMPYSGTSTSGSSGVVPVKYRVIDNLRTNSSWQTETKSYPGFSKDTVMRLIVSWYNSQTVGEQTPAAIDNISITALDCQVPTALTLVDYPDLHSARLKWTSDNNAATIAYRKIGGNWLYVDAITNPAVLANLDSNTSYEIKVQGKCQGSVLWSSSIQIKTPYTPITFPYEEDFEKGNTDWITVDGAIANKWYVGTVSDKERINNSIFISNDGGLTNAYTTSATTVHFYRDVIFPETGVSELSFDWKLKGSNQVFLRVCILDTFTEPKYATLYAGFGKDYYLSSSDGSLWRDTTLVFPDSLRGQKKRLVFTWRNTNANANPPASVDNIRLMNYHCGQASNIQATLNSSTQAFLKWETENADNSTIQYRISGTNEWMECAENPNTPQYLLTDLLPATNYQVRITPNCVGGIGRQVSTSFLTPYTIPFGSSFTSASPINWSKRISSSSSLSTFKDTIKMTSTSGKFNYVEFCNVAGERKTIQVNMDNWLYDWLITPPVEITTNQTLQLEFILGMTKNNENKQSLARANCSNILAVYLLATAVNDSLWVEYKPLAIWDYSGKYEDMSLITYKREGDKFIIPMEGYNGKIIRIGFYVEGRSVIEYNDLFIDSVYIRPYECSPVNPLKVSGIDFDAATIRWEILDKKQYQWELRYGKGGDVGNMPSEKVMDVQNMVLQGLDTNQIYNVFVRSFCGDSDTSEWKVTTFATLSPCEKIDEGNIVVTPSDTSAVINWAGGELHKTWELYYGTANQDMEQMEKVFLTQPVHTITDLSEQTDYSFFLRATCENGITSNWTDRQLFKTLRTPCLEVNGITTSNILINAATISWNTAQNTQSKWEVRYGSQGTTITAMKSETTPNKTVQLSNLEVDANYDVAIRAICRPDDTSNWAYTQFKTNSCEKIEDLNVEKSTDGHTATVTWTVKQGHTAWDISIEEQGNSAGEPLIVQSTSNSYVIDYAGLELSKTKNYYVTVNAKCGSAQTGWSEPVLLQGEGGIDAFTQTSFSISLSPNPAKDFTQLSISGVEGEVNVYIYSVKGELIVSEKLLCTPENTKEFTLKGLPRGAYTVQLIHQKWTRTEKLVVL